MILGFFLFFWWLECKRKTRSLWSENKLFLEERRSSFHVMSIVHFFQFPRLQKLNETYIKHQMDHTLKFELFLCVSIASQPVDSPTYYSASSKYIQYMVWFIWLIAYPLFMDIFCKNIGLICKCFIEFMIVFSIPVDFLNSIFICLQSFADEFLTTKILKKYSRV